MRSQNDKATWSILRFNYRTFTAQLARMQKVKNVYIPANITFIGEEAFHGCNRLEHLEIHHDPEYIGSRIVNKNCTICCKKGSKVDLYCEEQGLKREYI
ncbi:leucine-rich repeat protein [Blautia luti]|uniref:Leucine-rich repeat domain-containing protein n=1 Tax=Blautia luti TaxID=89014 RepID=A0A564WA50_9FIRM|nr:leucine-rich repeat protein [Blautia luti]VUX40863.1 Uncharacterised protein [Blautia luti]